MTTPTPRGPNPPPSTSAWLALVALVAPGCLSRAYPYAEEIACVVHTDCPTGAYCDADEDLCVFGTRNPACQHDGQCWDNEHCAAGRCTSGLRDGCDPNVCGDLDPAARCTVFDDQLRCQPAECINDYNCGPSRTCANGRCVDGARNELSGLAGDHCAGDGSCGSEPCWYLNDVVDNLYCAPDSCDDRRPYESCGPKAYCQPGTEPICIPRGIRDFGQPCDRGAECRGGSCPNGRCASFCQADHECPRGLVCVTLTNFPGWGACVEASS
jgi:hypothetical protein